jgi:hypothetical protein
MSKLAKQYAYGDKAGQACPPKKMKDGGMVEKPVPYKKGGMTKDKNGKC